MKRTLIASIAALFLVVASPGYAQDNSGRRQQGEQGRQGQEGQQGQQERNREGSMVTIRGCLAKGSQPQTYMVTDDTSGQNVTFAGPARLDDYINQTVEVTGQYRDEGGQRTFMPQAMRAVSNSCKSKGQ